ncbi:MAG: NCS2 family permease [Eggerthellaceae bacterium]|nr:NCS2 family permease [Eggerthellaceae bacterium]
MDKFFKISERGSSVSNEIIGGLTTFLAMAYIVAVNPGILEAAGIPFTAGLTATCIGAAIMCAVMGLVANRPIALASGMGINAIVAFSFCGGYGLDWRVSMSIVLIEGVVILLLVMLGLRKAIMDAIPAGIRRAIGIGIGLFIAFIGLKGAGIIIPDGSTYISMGDLSSPVCLVALFSLVVAIVLQVMNVRGALFISIIAAVILGIPLGVTVVPTEWSFSFDFSTFAAPLQTVEGGTMAIIEAITMPLVIPLAFSLLMSDFFDTMGTVTAVAQQAEFLDEDDNVEDIQPILAVDSLAAVVGGFLGASSITSYVESTSGAAEGARTGLSNLVVAFLFLVCAFLAPLFGMVSSSATCGALVVVGYLMMTDIGEIEWNQPEIAFPAFIIITCIPFTYSITNGIGLGFIAYGLVMIATGRIKEIKPLMWVSIAAFLAMFLLL